MRKRLRELTVERIKPPKSGRLEVWDTVLPTFGLRVTSTGAKSYVVSLRKPGSKYAARIKLGVPGSISLAEARDRARALIADPSTLDEPEPGPERAPPDTVGLMVAHYVEKHLKRNTRRWRDAEQMFERDVLPKWRNRLAADISRRDVLDLIEGVGARSAVSANRVLSLIRRLYYWGMERGIVEANPAARIKPQYREHSRDRVLTDDEIKTLWAAWTKMGYPFGTIQKLLLLTGQRRGEVANARWDQLDLDIGVWRLGAADTKTEQEHVVPLSPKAVKLLRGVPRLDPVRVFPANRAKSTRSVSGFSKAKRHADKKALEWGRKQATKRGDDPENVKTLPNWTWHDLRRTTATGMARLGVAPHVCERILNHSAGGVMSAIARVYNVHSYQREMREALDAWGFELARIVTGRSAKVVALRRRAKR
jgi:integrase